MRIEGSPFRGWFKSFGGNGTDSVAGTLFSGKRLEGLNRRQDVLKWNRQEILTAEDALRAGKFKTKSIALYKSALGDKFIVPTEIVVGSKKDSNGLKYKVYQVQPNIEGWSAYDLPLEIRESAYVVAQWEELSQRLFRMYSIANDVNAKLPHEFRFPITMTIGNSRQNSLFLESSRRLPYTKNIIVSSRDHRLQLFDFGEYVSWGDDMDGSYQEIFRDTQHYKEPTELQVSAIV